MRRALWGVPTRTRQSSFSCLFFYFGFLFCLLAFELTGFGELTLTERMAQGKVEEVAASARNADDFFQVGTANLADEEKERRVEVKQGTKTETGSVV
jgi:hypothetical protein